MVSPPAACPHERTESSVRSLCFRPPLRLCVRMASEPGVSTVDWPCPLALLCAWLDPASFVR
eukprot:14200971-Alexandrium_andersonii.AAC.1